MTRIQVLLFVAGAAVTSSAMAQNAGMDKDRAYQAELMADAGNRSSLLAAAGNAGWSSENGSFFIGDGTGNNTLQIGGDTEFRFSTSFRDDASVGDQSDFTSGFSTGFTRLRFQGSIWDKDFTYKIQLTNSGQSDSDSTFGLEDAWGMYNFGNGFALAFGQAEVPLIWQDWGVDVPFQLLPDQAIATSVFSPGYTQGVMGIYTADQFRVVGAFTDGAAAANTPYTSSAEADYAGTLRVDVAFMGAMSRFADETSFQSQTETALRVGAGIHYQSGGETGGTLDQDILVYTIDAQIEGGGWNAFAAFYGSNVDQAGSDSTDLFGGVIQGGIFVTDQAELFARWNAIFLDDSGAQDDDIHFVEAGANYYVSPESHAFKISVLGGYAFNDTTPIFGAGGLLEGNTRATFLGDSEDGEFVFGAEASILF